MADCGAELCDIMGDYFDKQPGEMTYNETAVKKQRNLIDKLHKRGAEVLMSTHIQKPRLTRCLKSRFHTKAAAPIFQK